MLNTCKVYVLTNYYLTKKYEKEIQMNHMKKIFVMTLLSFSLFFKSSLFAASSCTTIGCAGSDACHKVSMEDPSNTIWKTCASAGQDAKKLGKCIKKWMDDPANSDEHKDQVTQAVGEQCYTYCNKQTCQKIAGVGGDTNCKAVCCAAKAGDQIVKCCKAAGDKKCCG